MKVGQLLELLKDIDPETIVSIDTCNSHCGLLNRKSIEVHYVPKGQEEIGGEYYDVYSEEDIKNKKLDVNDFEKHIILYIDY